HSFSTLLLYVRCCLLSSLFLPLRRAPRALHSFPTRRSSDLFESGPHHSVAILIYYRHPARRQFQDRLGKSDIFPVVVVRDPCAVDRKSTRLNSSHVKISYAVFCLKKKKNRISPRSPLGGNRT